MYVGQEIVRGVEKKYGTPVEVKLTYEISADEMATVRGSRKHDRSHDVTLFIFDGPLLVVIRKPFHPPGVYRAPSGGLRPGEPFEDGARREAWEETGLEVELLRYLLRVNATFTCGPETEPWVSHVMEARVTGGVLDPIDTDEIAEARYAKLEELQGPIRRAMLASGRGLLAYRVALTDATLAALASELS